MVPTSPDFSCNYYVSLCRQGKEICMGRLLRILAIILVVGLVVGGTGCKESAAQPDGDGIVTQPEEQKSIELIGTVYSDSMFVDEDGETYILADTDKNAELSDLGGETIKVKATVMENDEGEREISIISYEVVQD